MNNYIPRHRQYKQDRIMEVYVKLGFININPVSDHTSYFFVNKKSDQIILIDKSTSTFPQDLVKDLLLPDELKMEGFDKIYDSLNKDKTFRRNNHNN